MSTYAKKQLQQKEDPDSDDDFKTRLDEAPAQLDDLSNPNMHVEESSESFEADCSEEDAPHIIT